MTDYYALLGVDSGATADEIRQAYVAASMRYHPDRNPDLPDAAQRFYAIREAYGVVGDPARRAAYDADRRASQEGHSSGVRPYEAPTAVATDSWILEETPARPPWYKRHLILLIPASLVLSRVGVALWQNSSVLVKVSHVAPEQVRNSLDERSPFDQEVATRFRSDTALFQHLHNLLLVGSTEEAIEVADAYASTRYGELPLTATSRAALFAYRASAKMSLQNDTGAVRDYGLALTFDAPGQADAWVNRGSAYCRLARFDDAERDFTQALRDQPNDVIARRARANLYYRLARWEPALADYTTLQHLQPMMPAYAVQAGACAMRLHRPAEARALWQAARKAGSAPAADSLRRLRD